jgi:cysteine desulfurase/selenocysteine lyase
MLDIKELRNRFPVLRQQVHGKPYVYLDNAATAQKPDSVIDAIGDFYRHYNSNVHRGVHHLSQVATDMYENTRKKVQHFIQASSEKEIIFTRGATESINLVADSLGRSLFQKGDRILTTIAEHHSNFVPWQMVARQYGLEIDYVSLLPDGTLDLDRLEHLMTNNTRLLAVGHVSNALGTVHPVKEIISKAHEKGVLVLVDGAQAVPHFSVNMKELDADFYCFSAHKMYGPTGVGVLYGKENLLKKMTPYQYGGEMIDKVSVGETTFNELPFKFEAGTPNIADVVAFGKAIEFLEDLGMTLVAAHEQDIMAYALKRLTEIEQMKIFGPESGKTGVISFLVGQIHPYDLGMLLDQLGVAVRTGHHCAQPLMDFYQIPGTVRVSFGVYNSREDIDSLMNALVRVIKMLT